MAVKRIGNLERVLISECVKDCPDFGIITKLFELGADINAVNEFGECTAAIVFEGYCSLYGDNTDFYGMMEMARRAKIDFAGQKTLILGSGGTSLTAVDVLWLEGVADPETVERVKRRIDTMDIDGIRTTGDLEEYLSDRIDTPFPLTFATQRPDRFCGGLLAGRVGVLCEGQSVGWLLPGTMDCFFGAMQDRTGGWMMATTLRLLRYLCMFITLLLPGLYVALVTFQPEVIPVKLAQSIVRAKQEVPFSALFEVLIMLLAFEVLQEAGLRLPGPVGQTVSILGGLVVGSAAVEARIVSPAVLIAVAIAGIAGYTVPAQDFANALRLWRFVLTLVAGVAGVAGLALGCVVLLRHLAGLESMGMPYLSPFSANVVRRPLPLDVFRRGVPVWRNRRRQK